MNSIINSNTTLLEKHPNGYFINDTEDNTLLLIYNAEKLNTDIIINNLIYRSLMYKSSKRRHISKASKYLISKMSNEYWCLITLKCKAKCMCISDLDIYEVKGKYYTVSYTKNFIEQMKRANWIEGKTIETAVEQLPEKPAKAQLSKTIMNLKEKMEEMIDHIKNNGSINLNQSLEKINWDLMTTVANISCMSNSMEFLHNKIDAIEEKIKNMSLY